MKYQLAITAILGIIYAIIFILINLTTGNEILTKDDMLYLMYVMCGAFIGAGIMKDLSDF